MQKAAYPTGATDLGRSVRASAKALTSPVARADIPDLDAARAQLASLPAGFTDAPAWPADVPEVVGMRN